MVLATQLLDTRAVFLSQQLLLLYPQFPSRKFTWMNWAQGHEWEEMGTVALMGSSSGAVSGSATPTAKASNLQGQTAQARHQREY